MKLKQYIKYLEMVKHMKSSKSKLKKIDKNSGDYWILQSLVSVMEFCIKEYIKVCSRKKKK